MTIGIQGQCSELLKQHWLGSNPVDLNLDKQGTRYGKAQVWKANTVLGHSIEKSAHSKEHPPTPSQFPVSGQLNECTPVLVKAVLDQGCGHLSSISVTPLL